MARRKSVPMEQVADVINEGRDAQRESAEPIGVVVLVDPQADRELVEALRDALMPEQPNAQVDVSLLQAPIVMASVLPDVCVIVAGGSDELVSRASALYARYGVPTAVVAETSLDAPSAAGDEQSRRLVTTIVAQDHALLLVRLSRWIMNSGQKDMAFAASFPFCRRELVGRLIQSCAAQNAAIGATGLIPGGDIAVMTVSQAKLALDISAAYGRPLDLKRAREMAAVAGGAFAYRGIARTAVGLVPGVGWALKAGVGYLGTVSTGQAIVKLYEYEDDGGSLGRGVLGAMRDAGAKVVAATQAGRGAMSALAGKARRADASDDGQGLVLSRAQGHEGVAS